MHLAEFATLLLLGRVAPTTLVCGGHQVLLQQLRRKMNLALQVTTTISFEGSFTHFAQASSNLNNQSYLAIPQETLPIQCRVT